MKRYALFLSFIAFGYILGWVGSVWRFGLPPLGLRHGPHEPHGPDRMFEGIGLNDEQRAAIRKIRTEEKAERDTLKAQLDESRRAFETALATTQDKALLQTAFEKMLASKNAMEQAHFQSMMKVHEVLTLDQIQKLGEKRPPRKPHREGPHDDGVGPPPPRD